MEKLTLGSLFDGSGGFPLGGLLAGITPVWASEIEPFAVRVTSKRLPWMKHYGDISTISGAELEPVDIITFGSPCQDMSIAGKRSGLDGSRSSLFYEAIRIIKEMRCATNGKYPRYCVWENVPGAFSSNGGRDFQSVLETVIGVKEADAQVPPPGKDGWPYADIYMGDGWSLAYRTIDAQFWGVPQRRRRIYLVADFAGGSAGRILFESEGLSGYSPESFRAWQRAARCPADCAGAAGIAVDGYNSTASDNAASHSVNCGMSTGRNGVLILNDQGGNRMDITEGATCTLRAEAHHPPLVFENHSQDTRFKGPLEVAQTVSATYGMGGNNQPLVVETPKTLKIRSGCEGGGKGALIQENKSATLGCHNDQTVFVPKAYGICSFASNAMQSDNPRSGFYEADTARTLDCNGGNPGCNQGGVCIVEQPSAFAIQGSMIGRKDSNGPQGSGFNEEVSFTLDAADRHAVAYCMTTGSYMLPLEGVAPTLMARDYKDPPLVNSAYGFDPMQKAEGVGFQEEVASTVVNGSSPSYHGGVVGPDYYVRRLTPVECARLQGFADWWCKGLGTAEPSDADIAYWSEVWETHRRLVSKANKPKTRNQIIKWLKNPYSDSAEYKLWGNGVALPCVFFVLSGIVWAAAEDDNTM